MRNQFHQNNCSEVKSTPIYPIQGYGFSPSDLLFNATSFALQTLMFDSRFIASRHGAAPVQLHYVTETVAEEAEIQNFVIRWNTFASNIKSLVDDKNAVRSKARLTIDERDGLGSTFHVPQLMIFGDISFIKPPVLAGDDKNGKLGFYRRVLVDLAVDSANQVNPPIVFATYVDELNEDEVYTLDELSRHLFGREIIVAGKSPEPTVSADQITQWFGKYEGFDDFFKLVTELPRRILAIRNGLIFPEPESRSAAKALMPSIKITCNESEETDLGVKALLSTTSDGGTPAPAETLNGYIDSVTNLLSIFLAPLYGTTKPELTKLEKTKAILLAHFVKEWVVANNILREIPSLLGGVDFSSPKGAYGKEIKKLLVEFKAKFGSPVAKK